MRRHWYRITYDWCPICMHTVSARERVYGRKPKTGTHVYSESWDGCGYG